MKINMRKRLYAFIIFIIMLFSVNVEVYADQPDSSDLVIIRKGLFDQIEYDSDWIDVNSDDTFDIRDYICMKNYLLGYDVDITPLKYIDVTFISGENQSIQRLYKSQYRLPELESPYHYWKIGKNYYNENIVYNFSADTTVTAVESKKDVDFPIIDF